jgi:transposase
LFELAVRNDEAAIERLLDRALESGPCALVIDQPGSIGSLAVCVARRRGVPVAYVPGLVMRRASELYPGEAKTDRRDSLVLADTARTHARRLQWLAVSDETLERLRLLGGYDDDLAHDVNRTANRLRDMLLAISPALRAAGRRRLTPLAKRHAPRMGTRLVDDIRAALAAQTITVRAEETAGRVIRELAEELDRRAARRDRLAHEIEQTFTSHPQAPVLMSIPGIGGRTGARILTEIGDINRFPTPGHLAAYAGLAPVTRPIRPPAQRRDTQPARQPPGQERHVAIRVLLPAPRPLTRLLRPQALRRQTPQRRHHLPTPPLRRHPRHAPLRLHLRRTTGAGKTGPPNHRPHSPPEHPLTRSIGIPPAKGSALTGLSRTNPVPKGWGVGARAVTISESWRVSPGDGLASRRVLDICDFQDFRVPSRRGPVSAAARRPRLSWRRSRGRAACSTSRTPTARWSQSTSGPG